MAVFIDCILYFICRLTLVYRNAKKGVYFLCQHKSGNFIMEARPKYPMGQTYK